MEPSPIARAVEILAGPWLAPLTAFLRTAAVAALAGVLVVCAFRIIAAVLAWKYGWERRTVVRCRRCGRVAADPEVSTCPNGHSVRFPAGARAAPPGKRERASDVARRAYALLVPAAAAAAGVWGYLALSPGTLRFAVSGLFASLAYLFFAAALLGLLWAISPATQGILGRVVFFFLAALCLAPAAVLGLLAEWVEPPARQPLGSLWTTPTATYVSTGRLRARRVGAAATEAQATIVEVRVPALGVVWQGLEGFRVGTSPVVWRGRGGWIARRVDSWAGPLTAHGIWLARLQQRVALAPNQRIWIVRDRRRLLFLREEELAVPELPKARAAAM